MLKVTKLTLIGLTLIIFSTIFIFKYPNVIGYFIGKISNYQVSIENIDTTINAKKIIFYSNRIQIQNKNFKSKIQNINLIIDFSHSHFPKISLIIDKFQIKIDKLTKNSNKLFFFKNIKVDINDLDLDYQGLKLNSQLKMRLVSQQKIISGVIQNINIRNNLQYLSLIKNRKLRQYLQLSIQSGTINNTKFSVSKINNRLIFDISGKINNGKIKFYPKWQFIDNINSNFHINNQQLILGIDNANMDKLNVSGQVIVNWKDNLFVKVDVTTITHARTAINFLHNAPLSNLLKQKLNLFNLTGKIKASVDLTIPLNNNQIQTLVNVDLIDNNFSALNKKIQIKNINAHLKYDDKLSVIGTANIFTKQKNINLEVTDFLRFNFYDKDSKIEIIEQNDNWIMNIIGNNITGEIKLDLSNTVPKLYLNNFNIVQKNNTTNFINFRPDDIINFNLVTNNIVINDYLLPNITSSFISKKNKVYINNIKFDKVILKQKNINIGGVWADGVTNFYMTLKSESLNNLFTILNIKQKTSGGNFKLDARISCQCNPWEITLSKISGYSKMKIEDGVFTEQDPSFGRILSLLNINALAKHLSLKIDDVVNRGFGYDSINAEIILTKKGIATIKNFDLNSHSSKINLTGYSNIVNKTYHLTANVIPAIKDSIPLITALTGGGLTGLGVWLIDKTLFKDKLLDSVLGKVTNFDYKITGSWKNPIIK